MKTILRPGNQRMHRKDAMKESWYAFVPYQTNFGALCGFADDIVEGGQGFGMHPHQDMEITTIMLNGKQKHKDDTGSEGELDANSLQTMSAGTGIKHSEFNASDSESFHSYQIWVYPRGKGYKPRHEVFSFSNEQKRNQVLLTISPDKRNNTVLIQQDAFFSLSQLEKGKDVNYRINLNGNGVYLHCASGSIEVNQQILKAGDAIGITETDAFNITAKENAELIFVEVPMHLGIKI